MSLIQDLRNRRVIRMAGIYVAVAWGATEILVTVVDRLNLPDSFGTIVVILFVVGFPVAMFLSWVFDVTPEGIRRTDPGTPKSAISIGLAFVFLIAGTAGLFYFLDSRTQARIVEENVMVFPLRSVAILPFESADADSTSAALAIGIADELLNRLGAIPELKITGRASSFSDQLHGLDAKTMGQKLGVRKLVQGSLRSTGEQLRVVVTVTDTISGYQVWSDSLNAPHDDLYRVSADLASKVVSALEINVGNETMKRVTRVQRTDPGAYDKYLLGKQRLRDLVGDNTVLAVRYFEEAIAIEPGFAKAHAGLSFALQNASLFARIPPEEAMRMAAEAAREAIALDPELADGHDALSALDWGFYWDWESSLRASRRSLALAPSNVDVLAGYGLVLNLTGEADAALEVLQRVVELDPLTPDHQLQLGWHLWFAGRAEKAVEQFLLSLDVMPDHQHATVYMELAWALTDLGRREEAIDAVEKSLELARDDIFVEGGNAWTLARLGFSDRALTILANFEATAEYPDPVLSAVVHTALGNKEAALDAIEQMIEQRSGSVVFLPQDATFDTLRGEPRFRELIERTGLLPWTRLGPTP